jgi:hypothetical protein
MARQANIQASFSIATFASLCRPQKCSAAIALFPSMVIQAGTTVPKTREEIMSEIQNLPEGANVTTVTLTKNLGDVTLGDLFDKGNVKKDLPEGTVTIDNLRKFAREWAEKFEVELFLKLAKESTEGKAELARIKAEKAANGETPEAEETVENDAPVSE